MVYYVQHMNYLGYNIWRIGIALLTGNWLVLLIPISLALLFTATGVTEIQVSNFIEILS